MNSPRQHEMDKLHRIQSQVSSIQQRIDDRLPHQFATMAAFVSAWKWRLHTIAKRHADQYTHEFVDSITKRLRMEVGTFDYATKEQGEFLTRYLCDLDNILSNGDNEIRDARKALVVSIQTLLERADAMKAKAAQLKEFTQRVIDQLPAPTTEKDEEMEETTADAEPVNAEAAQDEPSEAAMEEDNDHEPVSLRSIVDDEQEEDNDDEQEEDNATPQQQQDEDDADDENQEEEEDADDNMEEEEEGEPEAQENDDDNDVNSLPVWRPYYQIHKRPDGLYLTANLHGVDPRYLRVESIPREGLLRIVGVKFPTQKDMILSHLSGTTTYGRFEIVEQFPVGALRLDCASQQILSDGTLQVRLPYAVRQTPRVIRRVSPFMPGLAVW